MVEIKDPDKTELLLQKLASHFLCTTKVRLNSYLRLPGTFNKKISTQTLHCRVKYLNASFKYDLKDFEHLLLGQSPGQVPPIRPSLDFPSNKPAIDRQRYDDDTLGGIDDQEVKEFLQQDKSRAHFSANQPKASMPAHTRSQSIPPQNGYPASWNAEIVEVIEESSKNLADEVADKVVERLKATLADEIVEKLVDKLRK